MRHLRSAPPCLALAACGGEQSALAPAGPHAADAAALWWTMFIAAGAILAFVTALALAATLRRRRGPSALSGERFVIVAGAALPGIALSALLVWVFWGTAALIRPPGPEALRIQVVGKMWWWEVRYLNAQGEVDFVTANEIHLPVGRPALLELASADVIHSFWVPSLVGKIDLVPGHVNRWRVEAEKPVAMRGQCAEFCGLQHALMAFWTVAHEPAEFEAWRGKERAPAREPDDPFLRQGRETFLAYGCGACHAVRGTPAQGSVGPDLTHVGSRRSLAAGAFANHVGTLAGWIADADRLKPGNGMPSYKVLTGPELRALAAYLKSLE